MGKVGITHTSLVPYKHTRGSLSYAFSSPMSPALSFLSTKAHGLTHLFHFSLPESLSHHCMWWKNHKPNQGNRYERHKQLYQNTLQLSSASLGYTQAERCRPFLGAPRDTKTYYQSNFPLSPWAKQSVWEGHALFIFAVIEQGRTSLTEWGVREFALGGQM